MAGYKDLHKHGKKFSKENQPKNNGRKPSIATQLLEQYKITNGGKTLSKEDCYKIITTILQQNEEQIVAVVTNPETPIWIKAVGNAVLVDIKSGNMSTVDKLWTRIFGYPKQDVDLSNPDGSLTPQTVLYIPDNKRE